MEPTSLSFIAYATELISDDLLGEGTSELSVPRDDEDYEQRRIQLLNFYRLGWREVRRDADHIHLVHRAAGEGPPEPSRVKTEIADLLER